MNFVENINFVNFSLIMMCRSSLDQHHWSLASVMMMMKSKPMSCMYTYTHMIMHPIQYKLIIRNSKKIHGIVKHDMISMRLSEMVGIRGSD